MSVDYACRVYFFFVTLIFKIIMWADTKNQQIAGTSPVLRFLSASLRTVLSNSLMKQEALSPIWGT